MSIRWLGRTLVAVGAVLLVAGCGGQAESRAIVARTAVAGPTVAPDAKALAKTAETRYLPAMSPALAATLREQAWFGSMSERHLAFVAALQACERAAQRVGTGESVAAMLGHAVEQGWYADGLDDREATGLQGVFEAYAKSLSDERAPPVGAGLSATIEQATFEVVALKEAGEIVVLTSAPDASLGREALALAVDALPKVEEVVGPVPYHFLYIEVRDDLPAVYRGLSYNEFIMLSDSDVDAATSIHEITHSTVYGIFPIWFEEGLAHFVQYYLTDSVDLGVRQYTLELQQLRRDTKLDIRGFRAGGFLNEYAERAQGYLFLVGVYRITGIEGLSEKVRSLRTQTRGDQELLAALVRQGPPQWTAELSQLACKGVVGAYHNYCQQ